MAKDKEKSPFAKKSPYEDILGVGSDQIKKKVRGASPGSSEELFSSQDLFGDILGDFADSDSPPSSESPASESPPESASPVEHEQPPVRGPVVPPEPLRPKVRSDTVPITSSERREGDDDEYSLVDLAYSTLLKDAKLKRTVDETGTKPPNRPPEGSSEYGQYLLLDRIAVGGMAEVFRAKKKGVEGFEKIVAIKRILPHLSHNQGFVEMFIDEAKMAAGLSHPNITQIFELGKIEETYFIAMEYVDGVDLRTILTGDKDKEVVTDVDLAALIAAKVTSALEYAHRYHDADGRELRIVHRDVSPQNILISNEGEVKLVDFGIAKAAIKASRTDSGSLRGKLLYMSPEQAWGRPIDNRSDIFSLGLVLFEMLTGRCLFSGDSEVSILERVREARVIPPSSLSPTVPIELDAAVARALRKDPAERYQDASELLLHLDSYLRRRPAVGSTDLARFVKKHREAQSAAKK